MSKEYTKAIFGALEVKFGYNKAERLEFKYTEFIPGIIRERNELEPVMDTATYIVNEIVKKEA